MFWIIADNGIHSEPVSPWESLDEALVEAERLEEMHPDVTFTVTQAQEE